MIDTHCHLTYDPLTQDVAGVIGRAHQAGVSHLLTIGTSLDDSRRVLDVAARHAPTVAAAVGVHPLHAHEEAGDPGHVAMTLADLVEKPGVVAVGECGLDVSRDPPADVVARQREIFAAQLAVAADYALPVVVHSRQAVAETLEIMADSPGVRAVFHCFTGTLDEAETVLDRGYFIGFTGPITYKKSDDLRRVAAAVPPDRILVETDSPYLSPEPLRGKWPCEPAYVMHVARKLAEVRGVGLDELDAQTTANARALFRWPDGDAS